MHNKIIRIANALVFVSCVFVAGCVTSTSSPSLDTVMKSWMGDHVSKVVQSWGPADRITSDGADGKVYIWITPGIPPSQPRRVWVTEWNPLLGRWEGRWEEEPVYDASHGILRGLRKELEREAARTLRKEFFVRPNGIIYWYRTEYED